EMESVIPAMLLRRRSLRSSDARVARESFTRSCSTASSLSGSETLFHEVQVGPHRIQLVSINCQVRIDQGADGSKLLGGRRAAFVLTLQCRIVGIRSDAVLPIRSAIPAYRGNR